MANVLRFTYYPNPAFHFDADPNTNPTFHFDADSDPDPTAHFFLDLYPPKIQTGPLKFSLFHFDVVPDPAFHFDAGSGSTFPK